MPSTAVLRFTPNVVLLRQASNLDRELLQCRAVTRPRPRPPLLVHDWPRAHPSVGRRGLGCGEGAALSLFASTLQVTRRAAGTRRAISLLLAAMFCVGFGCQAARHAKSFSDTAVDALKARPPVLHCRHRPAAPNPRASC